MVEMTIVERDDDISQVALTGRLDAPAVDRIENSFAGATTEKKQHVIVDMSGIEFMASRGIGMLFANTKNINKAGNKLVLLNPEGMVDDVLRTSKMDKVMPIAYDLTEAVEILEGKRKGAARRPDARPAEQRSEPATTAAASLQLSIKNEIGELVELNEKLADFLKSHSVPYRATYAVNLAIDELVVNVIRYAYVDEFEHTIDIDLTIEGEQIVLRITDDGRPFDPRRGPSLNLHAEDRDVGGLGIILVLDLVDKLGYQRVEEKNCIEVRVHMIPEPEEEAEGDGAGDSDTAEEEVSEPG